MIHSAKVVPARHGIQSAMDGNALVFSIDGPRKLSVEVNGDYNSNLHLIANPLETDPISEAEDGIVYYGPGYYELDAPIVLDDNETLYVAGGAYLKFNEDFSGSRIQVLGKENVSIRGRGILLMDGDFLAPAGGGNEKKIHIQNSTNVSVEGIINIVKMRGFCHYIRKSGNITLNHVSAFGDGPNTDGVHVIACHDVEVRNCFMRTGDDTYCIKSKFDTDSRDITYTNCVAWADIVHRPICVGGETISASMENIFYQDIDILHYTENTANGAISFLVLDNATVTNVVFRNINIEHVERPVAKYINVIIKYGMFSGTPDEAQYRGNIRDVLFENIHCYSGDRMIKLMGYDADHRIDGVTFRKLFVDGEQIVSTEDPLFDVQHDVQNVSVDGFITLEAEAFDREIAASGSGADQGWVSYSDMSSYPGFSGNGYLQAGGEGENYGDSISGASVEYDIDFPSGGTWYVWVRMWGAPGKASIHAGFNGNAVTFGGEAGMESSESRWSWNGRVKGRLGNLRSRFEVPTAGTHVFNLWVREGSVAMDRIILTQDADFIPSDDLIVNGNFRNGLFGWNTTNNISGNEFSASQGILDYDDSADGSVTNAQFLYQSFAAQTGTVFFFHGLQVG